MTGLSVAGPGGLVVAGILANMGARTVANIIRQSRFNPQIQEVIRQGIRQDKKLLDKLLKKASPEDKALLERMSNPSSQIPRTEGLLRR